MIYGNNEYSVSPLRPFMSYPYGFLVLEGESGVTSVVLGRSPITAERLEGYDQDGANRTEGARGFLTLPIDGGSLVFKSDSPLHYEYLEAFAGDPKHFVRPRSPRELAILRSLGSVFMADRTGKVPGSVTFTCDGCLLDK